MFNPEGVIMPISPKNRPIIFMPIFFFWKYSLFPKKVVYPFKICAQGRPG